MRLEEKIPGPSGWTGADAGSEDEWTHSLPDELISEYVSGDGESLDAPPRLTEKWQTYFSPLNDELDRGRGFILLDRLPIESMSDDDAKRVYWRIGQSLGHPIPQNIEGTLLYDVRDTGQDVGKGARFSVTNAESTFHTDAAFMDPPPEYVGLLSLKAAKSGGRSQLVSAYTLHNSMLEEAADRLGVLYEPFSFDRRGQFRPGEPELMVTPVFRWDGIELDTKYLHYYITEGHKAGDPLTSEQSAALDAVTDVVTRPELRVEFSLDPGQILFVNNHWILHNRTAFEDFEDPEERRHYVRLWLERNGSRESAVGSGGKDE